MPDLGQTSFFPSWHIPQPGFHRSHWWL